LLSSLVKDDPHPESILVAKTKKIPLGVFVALVVVADLFVHKERRILAVLCLLGVTLGGVTSSQNRIHVPFQ